VEEINSIIVTIMNTNFHLPSKFCGEIMDFQNPTASEIWGRENRCYIVIGADSEHTARYKKWQRFLHTSTATRLTKHSSL
jgi:hypothetical protein